MRLRCTRLYVFNFLECFVVCFIFTCWPAGNKGGVGVSFLFGSVSLCFICTHLTSGNEKCLRWDEFITHTTANT